MKYKINEARLRAAHLQEALGISVSAGGGNGVGYYAIVDFDGLDRLLEEINDLKTTLEWYANRKNYAPAGGESAYDAITARDGYDSNGPGSRARAALSKS